MRKIIVPIVAAVALLAGAVPAQANVQADPVINSQLVGGCVSEHAGTGNTINIVVEAVVEAPAGALSLSVTCHLTQVASSGFTRHAHVGAASAAGTAVGGGVVTGWELRSYSLCTEIHASFLTGPAYHKTCPH